MLFHTLVGLDRVIVRSVRHKGLRRLVEADDRSGLPPAAVDKIAKIIFFMQNMESVDELQSLPTWKPHQLKGGRGGTWALHVTRNWRLTFKISATANEIVDLDYEDYH